MTTLPLMSTHQLLMIEDDVRLAQMVADYLGNNGLDVNHMADGKSGLEQLQPSDGSSAEPPDLVILDLNLPQMDGLEVLRAMRRRSNPAAVMILTARGTPEERVRGLDLGAVGYLMQAFGLSLIDI